MTDTRLDKFLPFVGVIGLILVWYIGYWMRIVDPVLLPPPDAAFKALWKGMTGGRLLFDFWQTVIRTFTAIAVAAVIATRSFVTSSAWRAWTSPSKSA